MAIIEQNTALPGVLFSPGVDVTVDILTAMQQAISKELVSRTKDFLEYPGFVWGFRIADVIGKSVLITKGVAFDQAGTRLEHSSDTSYSIELPTGKTSGWLCVRSRIVNVAYKVHPYTGERSPTETVIGLDFFIDPSSPVSLTSTANFYPSAGVGLVIALLEVKGATYTFNENSSKGNRSPFVALRGN